MKKKIITDPRGQWAHPGKPTRIPSNEITMQGVPYPVMAYPDFGKPVLMQPGQNYNFPEATYVDEYPIVKKGGSIKRYPSLPNKKDTKRFSKSLMATNKLFTQHPLLAKPKKNKIYDPKSKYFQDGGENEVGLEYLPKEERSYYNPIADIVYLNPEADEDEVNHELAHAWQNRQGLLRTNPFLPQQKPSMLATDEQAETYYDRRAADANYYLDNLQELYPAITGNIWTPDMFRFMPKDMQFEKGVDPIWYSDPATMEGEAEYLSQVHGRPPGLSFGKNGGKSNYIELELDDNEIDEYKKGGYIAEDISVTPINKFVYQDGGFIEAELSDDEIQELEKQGYRVELVR